MTVTDFTSRLRAKLEQDDQLRLRVEEALAADEILVDAISQMRETLEDGQIVMLLRHAIEVLEGI